MSSQIKAVKVYNKINALRRAIRREGTPAIQEAWDEVEPHVSIFMRNDDETAERKNSDDKGRPSYMGQS